MGYDWAERYVLKILIIYWFWWLIFFPSRMCIICTLEFQWSALEENLLMVSIHHHAIAHIMEAFWMKLSYKMWCWCASNGLQGTSRHLVCRTQLMLVQQRNKPSELCAVWASGPHEQPFHSMCPLLLVWFICEWSHCRVFRMWKTALSLI